MQREDKPDVAGDVVYRVPALSRCVPARPTGQAAPSRTGNPFGTIPVTQKALTREEKALTCEN
jgi:hypothetical protein